MNGIIYRVETLYGVHDHNTLLEAKKHSRPTDHIQFVINEVEIVSRVKRRCATPMWERMCMKKIGL